MADIGQRVRLSKLLSCYGALLTEYQRRVFETYNDFDVSLSEIAEEFGVTKQAIRDIVRRVTEQLEEYESKLKLSERLDRLGEMTDAAIEKADGDIRLMLFQIKQYIEE